MAKINLPIPKEYQDIIKSSGYTIEDLLGIAAANTIECSKCAIRCECNERRLIENYSCRKIWSDYLIGVKEK